MIYEVNRNITNFDLKLLLGSAEKNSHRFETSWGWVNDNFHFCVNYAINGLEVINPFFYAENNWNV